MLSPFVRGQYFNITTSQIEHLHITTFFYLWLDKIQNLSTQSVLK